MALNVSNINDQRTAAIRHCKSAFVRNIQCNNTTFRRHRANITADAAYEMVVDLSRIPYEEQMQLQQKQEQMSVPVPHLVRSKSSENQGEGFDHSDICIINRLGSVAETRPKASSAKSNEAAPRPSCHIGFRQDYALGESIRDASHMIVPFTFPLPLDRRSPSPSSSTTNEVDTLQTHDFAWVKRSNGTYTYSIIAYRTPDVITFVMCENASTKKVQRKHWGKFVRLVAPEKGTTKETCATGISQGCQVLPTIEAPKEAHDAHREVTAEKYLRTSSPVQTVPLFVSFTLKRDDDLSVVSDISLPHY